jgi:hypothetical protein
MWMFEECRMSSSDPKTPGDGSTPPEDDEHGAKLAKFFSQLEQEVPDSEIEQPGDQGSPDAPN